MTCFEISFDLIKLSRNAQSLFYHDELSRKRDYDNDANDDIECYADAWIYLAQHMSDCALRSILVRFVVVLYIVR